jgi:hypothetical protein
MIQTDLKKSTQESKVDVFAGNVAVVAMPAATSWALPNVIWTGERYLGAYLVQ